MAVRYSSVDEYLGAFPAAVRTVLEEVRATLHAALPGSGEKISYNIAAITVDGRPVVHFAGWKSHLSLYPAPAGDADFERAIAPYRAERSTLKFPLDEPIPYPLIGRVATLLAGRDGAPPDGSGR
jgi:uncharacterized protein YdhG (YjbR/CyaY superfamily)